MIALYLSILFIASFTLYSLTIDWQWSVLMDELHFIQWMPFVQDFWNAIAKEFHLYWSQGRFTPAKYVLNLAKFNFLPLNNNLFHFINLVVFYFSGALMCLALTKHSTKQTKKLFVYTLLFIGFLILQRPVLDMVALNTIPESYVVLFLALGFYFFSHPVLYRLFFLCAALSKEPAVMLFIATALYWGLCFYENRKLKYLRSATLDGFIALTMLIIVKKAMSAGPYLANYSLLDPTNIIRFGLGITKVSIGLIPLIILFKNAEFIKKTFRKYSEHERGLLFVLLFFGFSYLYLVTARLAAGYLILPASFALYAAAFFIAHKNFEQISFKKSFTWTSVFLFCSLLVGLQSFLRYDRYQDSINTGTALTLKYFNSSKIDFLFVQGSETAATLNDLKRPSQQKATVEQTEVFKNWDALKNNRSLSLITAIEYTAYYGPLSDEFKQNVKNNFGELKIVFQNRSVRVFQAAR